MLRCRQSIKSKSPLGICQTAYYEGTVRTLTSNNMG